MHQNIELQNIEASLASLKLLSSGLSGSPTEGIRGQIEVEISKIKSSVERLNNGSQPVLFAMADGSGNIIPHTIAPTERETSEDWKARYTLPLFTSPTTTHGHDETLRITVEFDDGEECDIVAHGTSRDMALLAVFIDRLCKAEERLHALEDEIESGNIFSQAAIEINPLTPETTKSDPNAMADDVPWRELVVKGCLEDGIAPPTEEEWDWLKTKRDFFFPEPQDDKELKITIPEKTNRKKKNEPKTNN